MPQIWLSIIGLVGAVFLFGFAVFVHELGHFLVAKWCGVGVKKFAIGMGPIIWSITRGGTEYSLRWFPVGGFVSLKGDPADEEAEAKAKPEIAGEAAAETVEPVIPPLGKDRKPGASADLDALSNQPALKKIAVFVAGITCNYLTAIILMAFLLWYGIPKSIDLPTTIERIPENSQLYRLGWRSGDRIVAVKSKPVKVWDDVLKDLSKGMKKKAKLGKPMPITVQRDATTITLPSPYAQNLSKDELEYFTPALPAFIGAVEPGSPAFRTRLISDNYNLDQKAGPEPEWGQMRQTSLEAGDLGSWL